MANKISHGLGLVLPQHQGGPSLHGVHDKQCDEISVEERPAGYDKVLHFFCSREVYATHSVAYEPKVILSASLQLSVCVLL